MENKLQLFQNEEFGKIRAMEIDGAPWFVGKDVCEAFSDSHYRRSIALLDDDEKGVTQMDTPGGRQNMTIINESGLYSLLFMMKPSKGRGVSKDHIAERETRLRNFRRWVTSEVLPSIRKHGAYMTEELLREVTRNQDAAFELFDRLRAEMDKSAALREYAAELAPKARYYDIILQNKGAVQVSVIAKDYGMSAVAFNRLLHDAGIQHKIGKTWLLYQKYSGMGYTMSRTYPVNDYTVAVHTYWTQKGRLFLYNLLKEYGIIPQMEAQDATACY